jgi:hypothetical protein
MHRGKSCYDSQSMHEPSSEFVRVASRGRADFIERPARQRWALVLWAAQVLATLIVLLAACSDIESIVFGLPTLTILGLVLAVVVRPLGSWAPMLFALSGPVVGATAALVIAAYEMMPHEAQIPIATMLVIYGFSIAPSAIAASLQIQVWDVPVASRSTVTWRYSLKSLLILTTFVCVVTAILSLALKSAVGFPIVFASYALVAIGLAFLVAWRFASDRRRRLKKQA